MYSMYPDVEDGRTDNASYEHPLTAIGIILLSAALMGTIELRTLTAFTPYSQEFVSSVVLNMLNNRLWTDQGYDHSAWLLEDGTIEAEQLWEHVEMACGALWKPNAATEFAADPCGVYWDESA